MAKQVFSQEELDAMGVRTLDALTKALEDRDVEGAQSLATQMYNEFSSMHHLYVDWIAGLMDVNEITLSLMDAVNVAETPSIVIVIP